MDREVDISDLDLGGKVTVGDQVGFGGFSNVFQGKLNSEGGTETEIAIKALRIDGHNITPESIERLRKRFFREVLLWRDLRHSNIVPLLGYIMYQDWTPALVSPWYVNGNVVHYLKLHPTSDRRSLATDVASGLEYLHSIPVSHGDLKGENALVNAEIRASICDFGMSQLLDEANQISGFTTSNAYAGGTDRFMSPENFVDGIKTTAVDIWALGCLVSQIFTDKIPYAHIEKRPLVAGAIMRGEQPHGDRGNSISESLWGCIKKCWSVQPNGRPSATVVKSYIKYSARVSPVDEEILKAFLLPNAEKGFTGNIVAMDGKTKSIILILNNIQQSLNVGNGLASEGSKSTLHQYHLKVFCRFIEKSRVLATLIVESCNKLQSAILPLAHTLEEETIVRFSHLFEMYKARHWDIIDIETYDSDAFAVFREKMVSFAHSLRKHWGPFEANILGVKKQQDDLDTELVTLEKELEILESQPSTSSPSTRSFIGAIASSFTWTNSRPRSPAEISDRIKAVMSEKELLDKHPGYEEARVRLDAIATVKKDVDRVIDVLESVWKPAVDDCRSIREIFERISLIRSPELIRRELRSVNTIYDLLADSLDAYTIGMKDVEEQLQRLM